MYISTTNRFVPMYQAHQYTRMHNYSQNLCKKLKKNSKNNEKAIEKENLSANIIFF